eukprot:gene6714-6935_t
MSIQSHHFQQTANLKQCRSILNGSAGAASAEISLNALQQVLLQLVQGAAVARTTVLHAQGHSGEVQEGFHDPHGSACSAAADVDLFWSYRDGAACTADTATQASALPYRQRRARVMLNSPSTASDSGDCADDDLVQHQSVHSEFWSTGHISCSGRPSHEGDGQLLIPVLLQQQREQLYRLRAAQQQAWHSEMMIQHEPWEGAYSPVATAAAETVSSAGHGAGGWRLADILQLSHSGSCRSSLGGDYGAC